MERWLGRSAALRLLEAFPEFSGVSETGPVMMTSMFKCDDWLTAGHLVCGVCLAGLPCHNYRYSLLSVRRSQNCLASPPSFVFQNLEPWLLRRLLIFLVYYLDHAESTVAVTQLADSPIPWRTTWLGRMGCEKRMAREPRGRSSAKHLQFRGSQIVEYFKKSDELSPS